MPEFPRFDFAVSFAGEDRGIAELLVGKLCAGGAEVFYDRHYTPLLLGKKADDVIQCVYAKNTRFFVALISRHYVCRHFPTREFLAAKDEEARRPEGFILPLRLDDTPLPGLNPDVFYLDLRSVAIDQAAEVLLAKLAGSATVVDSEKPPTHWVATFGISVEDLLSNWEIPSDVPRRYALLCDWLEKDPDGRLRAGDLGDFYYPEASARDGETLSVRIAFELPIATGQFSFGDLAWWELLEFAPFSEIYPGHEF